MYFSVTVLVFGFFSRLLFQARSLFYRLGWWQTTKSKMAQCFSVVATRSVKVSNLASFHGSEYLSKKSERQILAA